MDLKYLVPKELSCKVLMIGVFWKNHAPGGVSSVVNTYAENFETMNYIVTAASRDESKLKKLLAALVGLISFYWQMLTNKQVEIVHVQGSHGASFDRKKMFVKIAKRFGKKVVWHMHASQFVPFYEGRKDKDEIVRCLNMADKLIVLSQYYYDFYKGIGVAEDKLVILNNIVSHPDVKTIDGDGKLHLLFLGEISKRKGAFDLVQAFKENKDLCENVVLKIGGNGETESLCTEIRNAGLDNCVSFEGWISGQKKTDLLNWCDVYILPSYNEGLPISILEALSYGCPVISTPVGGIEEVVVDERRNNSIGANGRIVTPGNTSEIADAIRYYLDNKEMIKVHSENSQKLVEPFYPEPVFEKLRNIYEAVLS